MIMNTYKMSLESNPELLISDIGDRSALIMGVIKTFIFQVMQEIKIAIC